MPDFSSLNWIAILVSTVVYFALSWAWYGPLFGKKWAEGMGMTMDPNMKPEPKHFVVTLGGYFILITALAGALNSLGLAGAGSAGLGAAIQVAAWLWFGFIAAVTLASAIWDTRPLTVWGINASLSLVGLIVATIVLVSWPA